MKSSVDSENQITHEPSHVWTHAVDFLSKDEERYA